MAGGQVCLFPFIVAHFGFVNLLQGKLTKLHTLTPVKLVFFPFSGETAATAVEAAGEGIPLAGGPTTTTLLLPSGGGPTLGPLRGPTGGHTLVLHRGGPTGGGPSRPSTTGPASRAEGEEEEEEGARVFSSTGLEGPAT